MLAVFKPGNLLNGFNNDITIQTANAHLSNLCIFEGLPPTFFLRAKVVTQMTPCRYVFFDFMVEYKPK